MRLACFVLLSCVPTLLADPAVPKAPAAREIKLTGLRLPARPGGLTKPTKISSEADLAKAVPDKDARAAIAKQVDFKSEYLLLFAWSGSGGDRLSFRLDKDKNEAIFASSRGRTRDLRRHVKLFAFPNKTTYRLGE